MLSEQQKWDDAVLSFEQVFNLCETERTASQALYEIAKIRVQQRDFYEAAHVLQRSDEIKDKTPLLKIMALFVDSGIHLMKRKTKKGVAMLSKIIDAETSL